MDTCGKIEEMGLQERISQSVLTFAYGDAYGFVTEFWNHSKILKREPEPPSPLVISDDTQMSLYTLKAIEHISENENSVNMDTSILSDTRIQNIIRRTFAEYYLQFASDKDNNRAPGATVMNALGAYSVIPSNQRITGAEGATNYSLGCGTVMRSPWIGLLPYDREVLAALSIIQAQTTHGDPTGWLVSAIATVLVHDILNDQVRTPNLFVHAIRACEDIVNMDTPLVESIKNDRTHLMTPAEKVMSELNEHADGFEEIQEIICEHVNIDVNNFYGQGWISTEALYNALALASAKALKPSERVKRLVYTQGDSDSTAAISGAFIGADSEYVDIANIHTRLESRYHREISEAVEFVQSKWKE